MVLEVPRKKLMSLLIGMAILVTFGGIVSAGDLLLRHLDLDGAHWFFHLDFENNLPALFSYSLWLIAALLMGIHGWIAHNLTHPDRWRWIFIAGLGAFLGLDEALALHEHLIDPLRAVLNTQGLLNFPWVLVYGPLGALVLLGMIPFLRRLPVPFARRFIVSGAIFASGAVGLEMVGAYVEQHLGKATLAFQMEVIMEESLEMAGVLYFIDTLLRYFESGWSASGLTLSFRPGHPG